MRITFFGDIMRTDREWLPQICPELKTIFSRADLVIGNCEGPVIYEECEGRKQKDFRITLAAEYILGLLAESSIDPKKMIFSLANNHIADAGDEGVAKTLDFFSQNQIRHVGLHRSGYLVPIRFSHLNIGICAWSHWENFKLTKEALWREQDVFKEWSAIDCDRWDLLIGYPHWGYEFAYFPSPETYLFGTQIIKSSPLQLIVGSHPHLIQPLDIRNGKILLYSIGNFLSAMWSIHPRLIPIFEVGINIKGQISGYQLHFFLLLNKEKQIIPLDQARQRVQFLKQLEMMFTF